jgi:ATP-dependent Clp protease ATP-binding subunit ClpC
MFKNFTVEALEAMKASQEEARRMGHNFVGTEQLLLGLVSEGSGVAAQILLALDVTLQKVRTEVEKIIDVSSDFVSPEILLTPRATRILEVADQEAQKQNQDYVQTGHILIALIQNGEGVAISVLRNLGISLPDVQTQIQQMLRESKETIPSAPVDSRFETLQLQRTASPKVKELVAKLTDIVEDAKTVLSQLKQEMDA